MLSAPREQKDESLPFGKAEHPPSCGKDTSCSRTFLGQGQLLIAAAAPDTRVMVLLGASAPCLLSACTAGLPPCLSASLPAPSLPVVIKFSPPRPLLSFGFILWGTPAFRRDLRPHFLCFMDGIQAAPCSKGTIQLENLCKEPSASTSAGCFLPALPRNCTITPASTAPPARDLKGADFSCKGCLRTACLQKQPSEPPPLVCTIPAHQRHHIYVCRPLVWVPSVPPCPNSQGQVFVLLLAAPGEVWDPFGAKCPQSAL